MCQTVRDHYRIIKKYFFHTVFRTVKTGDTNCKDANYTDNKYIDYMQRGNFACNVLLFDTGIRPKDAKQNFVNFRFLTS